MKRWIALIMMALLALGLLAACSDEEPTPEPTQAPAAVQADAGGSGLPADLLAVANERGLTPQDIRAALKTYLQRLNEPKQPDDAQFEALIAAPFTPPPKKKTNDRRF